MADRVTELSSPPYMASNDACSKSASNSIGNISHASHNRKKLLMQRGFSVTDSHYSPNPAMPFHPLKTPTTAPLTTTATTTSTAADSKTRKARHGSGSKWADLLRAPFERTWSVPDHYSSTNASSPASKTSSRSSIEKIISKEEAQAMMRRKQLQPMVQYPKPQQVVIEAPIDMQEARDYSSKHSSHHYPPYHPLSSYHYFHPKEKPKEDTVYLDDNLVDFSPTPTNDTSFSHPILPPSYKQVNQEFQNSSVPLITSFTTSLTTSLTTSSSVSGNVYTNPSHFQISQGDCNMSQTGTPVEVKLSSIGSPVHFSPFVTTSGSLGGLTGNGTMIFGAKTSSADASAKNHSKNPKRRPAYCSTQPNSPTSTRQKVFPFFGKIRRFPSLKLQRAGQNKGNLHQPLLEKRPSSHSKHLLDDPQTDALHIDKSNNNNNNTNNTNNKNNNNYNNNNNNNSSNNNSNNNKNIDFVFNISNHSNSNSNNSLNKSHSKQNDEEEQKNTQQRDKQSQPSPANLVMQPPPVKRPPFGPTITVTTLSEDDLPKTKAATANHLSPPRLDAHHFDSHLKEEARPYGTSGHGSPPPHPSGGDHFKFTSSGNVNLINPTSTSIFLRDQIISFFQPSDNKLAMKLFGNKNALMKEKMRQKAAGNWVIHPCSNFRFYWDLFMLVLLIANLIILPVAISFFNDDFSTKWVVFNGLSDTVFLLDLIINFRTGIIADNFADDIILEPREIAKHYLRTWFFLDLISSIPLDNVILLFSPDANITQLIHAGRALRIVRLVKLLSLLRLLRLSRLVRYVSQWEEDIGQFLTVASKFMRIVNLVCLILLLGHWNGCLQWLVPMIQEFPRDSWAALEELQNAHWTEQYTWALFKALSHMLCIGYGRYPPQSTTDVWLTTVSMLTGATCYALFVGHSTTLIQSFDTSRRLYREKFKQVEEYMIYRKLPRKLRQKITDYYEHRYQGKMFDEQSILAEVNECLREEIINFNCRALVASVPFFTHADPNFVSDIVTNLRHEMFQPGDYIIREGSVGTKVYFIQEGIVDIITQNGEVATSLSDGSYFGEICLLAKTKRTASVRAEAYCNLFSLSVEHFDSVLERYPLMRRTMESVAAERLNKIGKDPCILSNRDDLEADISMVNELIMRATPLPSSGSDDSDGHVTDDDRKPQKKRKKKDDQASNGGGSSMGKEHTLTVKLATMLRRSRSNLNMARQPSRDEK